MYLQKDYVLQAPGIQWEKGDVGLLSWIESMEVVLRISKCSNDDKVEYATCLLQGRALTWWNTQLQIRGREAALLLTWEEFKNCYLKNIVLKVRYKS